MSTKTGQALNPVWKYIWGGQGNIWLHQRSIMIKQWWGVEVEGGGILTLLPGRSEFKFLMTTTWLFSSRRKQKIRLSCRAFAWNLETKKLKNGSYNDAHLSVHMFVFYAHQKYNCICLYSGNSLHPFSFIKTKQFQFKVKNLSLNKLIFYIAINWMKRRKFTHC